MFDKILAVLPELVHIDSRAKSVSVQLKLLVSDCAREDQVYSAENVLRSLNEIKAIVWDSTI